MLSGYAEGALAAGAAQIAHAVLMKPCDVQALKAAIEIAGPSHVSRMMGDFVGDD